MQKIKTTEGSLLARDLRVAIVATRFNDFIVDHLTTGALGALRRHGAQDSNIELVRAPGAYELPLVVKKLATSRRFDCIVALGAVIRGATPHFDYVAGECSKGLSKIALDHDIPIGFGVLTVDSIEQAIERAGTKSGNKGGEAAISAIETANLLRNLGG